jgi:putative transposase
VPYWRLFYHLVWTTQGRVPVLDEERARLVARSLRSSGADQNAIVHAIGIMPDHVHVAASIPPSIAVSTFVGRLKGAASHAVNAASRDPGASFAWQAEYGALSFGERALPDVVAYVENQRSRHAEQRLWDTLELVADRAQPASAGLSGSARGL